MKKAYSKPVIVFEDFSLTTSIAGDCERLVGNPSKGTCGIPGSGGINVFSSTVTGTSGCTIWDSDNDDVYDGFCYHVPTEAYTLFNS